jgi:hypothetical protein
MVSVGDIAQPGYIVPLVNATTNDFGMQYPTDVARIQCECSWVAPTLSQPPPANATEYIRVTLDSFDIQAIQHSPVGISGMC